MAACRREIDPPEVHWTEIVSAAAVATYIHVATCKDDISTIVYVHDQLEQPLSLSSLQKNSKLPFSPCPILQSPVTILADPLMIFTLWRERSYNHNITLKRHESQRVSFTTFRLHNAVFEHWKDSIHSMLTHSVSASVILWHCLVQTVTQDFPRHSRDRVTPEIRHVDCDDPLGPLPRYD